MPEFITFSASKAAIAAARDEREAALATLKKEREAIDENRAAEIDQLVTAYRAQLEADKVAQIALKEQEIEKAVQALKSAMDALWIMYRTEVPDESVSFDGWAAGA